MIAAHAPPVRKGQRPATIRTTPAPVHRVEHSIARRELYPAPIAIVNPVRMNAGPERLAKKTVASVNVFVRRAMAVDAITNSLRDVVARRNRVEGVAVPLRWKRSVGADLSIAVAPTAIVEPENDVTMEYAFVIAMRAVAPRKVKYGWIILIVFVIAPTHLVPVKNRPRRAPSDIRTARIGMDGISPLLARVGATIHRAVRILRHHGHVRHQTVRKILGLVNVPVRTVVLPAVVVRVKGTAMIVLRMLRI